MPDVYQMIINKVEDSLIKYRETLQKIDLEVRPLFCFSINYKNERSVAAFITYQLLEVFNSAGMKEVNVMNEFDLRINSQITYQQQNDIDASVDQALVTVKKKKFIPDTFATFIDKTNRRVNVFIEYKINDSFKYLQLANDYIKFKHYTINSQEEPIFAYLLFRPNDNGLSITLKNDVFIDPKYQLIGPNIDTDTIDHQSSVFIYNSNNCGLDVPNEVFPVINNIQEKIQDFYNLSLHASFEDVTDYGSNIFYSNSGKFGSRVLTAHRIQKKYGEIIRLFNLVQNYHGKIEVPVNAFISLESFKSSSFDESVFIEELSKYFNNQIRHQTREDESGINNAEFYYTRKRALWIQILLQKFADNISVDFDLIHFYDKREKQDSSEIFQKLDRAYQGKYSKNFNQLALGLLYYIVKLYESMFVIEENKVEYKGDYLAFEIKSSILNSLKKMKAKLGLKRNTIDWNSSVLIEGAKILSHIMKDY